MAASSPAHSLDLSSSPPIFVIPTHLQPEELHETEDHIYHSAGHITYDAKEARLFIGRVAQKKRAAFDLRAKGVWTEEAALPEPAQTARRGDEAAEEGPARKKVRLSKDGGSMGSSKTRRRASSSTVSASSEASHPEQHSPEVLWPDLSNHVLVLKLAWLDTCVKEGKMVPFKPYIVYSARIIPKPEGESTPKTSPTHAKFVNPGGATNPQVVSLRRTSKPDASSILERARAEAATLPTPRRRWGDHGHHSTTSSTQHKRPQLHRTTTSEMEYLSTHPLPPLPDWALGPNAPYAACRSTFLHPPNAAFIAQLSKIKEARLLRLDDIGVRAYSTSIASIAAYPHLISHAEEITRLPGCESKIASLWREWQDSADTDGERCHSNGQGPRCRAGYPGL